LNWAERRKDYEMNGLADCLVTTDDLEGIKEDRILQVIDDLVSGKLEETAGNKFSTHHYQLY
jgi:exodeoxyribonuclease V alpha subunit